MGKARAASAPQSRAANKSKVKPKVTRRSHSASPLKATKGKPAVGKKPSPTRRASANSGRQAAKKGTVSKASPKRTVAAKRPSTPVKKVDAAKSRTPAPKKTPAHKASSPARKSPAGRAHVNVAKNLKANAIKRRATALHNKSLAKKSPVKKVVSSPAEKAATPASKKTPVVSKKAAPVKKATPKASPEKKKSDGRTTPARKAPASPVRKTPPRASPEKKKTEDRSTRKPPVKRVAPQKRVVLPGRGKLPSVVLRKAALSKTKAAKKTMQARLAQNKSQAKSQSNASSEKAVSKPETKITVESPRVQEVKKSFVSSDKTTVITNFTAKPQRESSPSIRIDLTGAKPKPAVEKKKLEQKVEKKVEEKAKNIEEKAETSAPTVSPPQPPLKGEARAAAEKQLMKTLKLGPKQAQNLVQTLYKQVMSSGKSPTLQYQVSTDESGNSILTQIYSPEKAAKPAAEHSGESQVIDLSGVGMSPVSEQVIAAASSPKKAMSFDLTASRPKLAKRTQEEVEDEQAEDSSAKKAKVGEDENNLDDDENTLDELGKKKNVYYLKMKSKQAKGDRGLQEFLEQRKAKRTPSTSEPAAPVKHAKGSKKSNIIVRCSACKNYFEPGKDFSSHKSECLRLHARCSGCQKYFQRGEEYDAHKAQCTAVAVPEAVKEVQNEKRWEEVINPAAETTPTSPAPKFRCLVCRLSFKSYRETRLHEEQCALSKTGEPKGVMCSDCKRIFKGRMFLSRHKTQYPGCPVKPVPLVSDPPSKDFMALMAKRGGGQDHQEHVDVQVTLEENGPPKVALSGSESTEKGEEGAEKRSHEDDEEEEDEEVEERAKKIKVENSEAEREQRREGATHVFLKQAGVKSPTEKFEALTRVKGLKLMDGTPLSKCPLCDKLFKHTEYLKKHFNSFHNLDFEMFVGGKDKLVDSVNRRSETLQARFRQKRGCTCLDCGEWFVSRLELNLHKRTCTKKISAKVVFPCTLCNEMCVFPTRVELYEHMRKAHSEDAMLAQTLNYGCQICHAKFTTQEELDKHGAEHHEAGLSDSGQTKRCLDCGLLVDASKLGLHKQKCTSSLVSKPFVCFDCHEQFNTRTELTEHKRDEHLFSGAPYKCWQCMSNFNFYPDLIQHVMDKHRRDRQAAELLAQAAQINSEPKTAEKPAAKSGQVYKVAEGDSVVKVNMETSGKSIVLDISKLKELMEADGAEAGKKGVITLPASALASLAVEAGKKERVAEPVKEDRAKDKQVADKGEVNKEEDKPMPPLTAKPSTSAASNKERMTAALALQPADSEGSKKVDIPGPRGTRTRSATGTTPPRGQGATSPARSKSPAVASSSPTRSKSPGAAPAPSSPAPRPSTAPPTTPSPSPRKKHLPAILKRGSSSPKPSPPASVPAPSRPAGQMLQAVGKDQVMCMQCHTVLATMQAVATHTCLTDQQGGGTGGAEDTPARQWSLQKVEGSSDQEDVEWFVAST